MKRLLAALLLVLTFGVATAGASPSYCGNSPYDISYKAIYQYPSGSYWVKQINAYPDYYTAHNAYYQAHYGC